MSSEVNTLSAFTRMQKLFFHKNGIAILIMLATMKKPFYHLHWWVYVNMIMSLFMIYVYVVRDTITEQCEESFWSNPSKDNIMKEYISDYACTVDRRFFDPDDTVYMYLLLNVLLTPFLIYFLLKSDRRIMYIILTQGVATIGYFVTKSWSFKRSLKSIIYTVISALWVIYPVLLSISL
jgi:hypothetical protein